MSTELNIKDMQKRTPSVLVLFALLTMTCLAVFLFRSEYTALQFLPMPFVVKRNLSFFGKMMEHVGTTPPPDVSQKTIATSVKPLEPCPDTPPALFGPLLVEFETKRTLQDVRNDVGSLLQQGGRYKPPNCIAKQKVSTPFILD